MVQKCAPDVEAREKTETFNFPDETLVTWYAYLSRPRAHSPQPVWVGRQSVHHYRIIAGVMEVSGGIRFGE